MANDVATVNGLIDFRPATEGIRGQKVLLQNLIDVIGHIGTHTYIVAAQFSPHSHSGHGIAVFQRLVAAVHHTDHISLLRPIVLQHHVVHGQDIKEVRAAAGRCG